jgi:hypothetical protein
MLRPAKAASTPRAELQCGMVGRIVDLKAGGLSKAPCRLSRLTRTETPVQHNSAPPVHVPCVSRLWLKDRMLGRSAALRRTWAAAEQAGAIVPRRKMATGAASRPLSPHLTIYKFRSNMITSVMFRGTGIVMTGGASRGAQRGPGARARIEWAERRGPFFAVDCDRTCVCLRMPF